MVINAFAMRHDHTVSALLSVELVAMISRTSSIVLVAIAGMMSTLLVTAMAAGYQEFEGYAVVCSQGHSCTISSAMGDETGRIASVWFTRTKREAPVKLGVMFRDTPDTGAVIQIEIDRQKFVSERFSELKLDPNSGAFNLSRGLSKLQIDALLAGHEINIAIGVQPPEPLSLEGFRQAFQSLEQVQRIPDGDGFKDDYRPKEPGHDILKFEDLTDKMEEFLATQCEDFEEDAFRAAGAFVSEIGYGNQLIGLPCSPTADYNQRSILIIRRGEWHKLVALPTPTSNGLTAITEIQMAEWDVNSQILESTSFLADETCGRAYKWKLEVIEDATPTFKLVEAREQLDCKSAGDNGENDWPIIWNAVEPKKTNQIPPPKFPKGAK